MSPGPGRPDWLQLWVIAESGLLEFLSCEVGKSVDSHVKGLLSLLVEPVVLIDEVHVGLEHRKTAVVLSTLIVFAMLRLPGHKRFMRSRMQLDLVDQVLGLLRDGRNSCSQAQQSSTSAAGSAARIILLAPQLLSPSAPQLLTPQVHVGLEHRKTAVVLSTLIVFAMLKQVGASASGFKGVQGRRAAEAFTTQLLAQESDTPAAPHHTVLEGSIALA
eukprot:CAMPEP_0184327650 /NCGR_PEP_ID=MMETSP1049-20130417/143192_1 /TAXON_ID=77928 /ORGANISM="Proteomonas sulcata, Strain CCMP704" /LENGTH=216 /DNA_ID=CAMNT_0026649915 /DNA_START=866 /DNA_END=1519 /DNA_ORIENTATION=+